MVLLPAAKVEGATGPRPRRLAGHAGVLAVRYRLARGPNAGGAVDGAHGAWLIADDRLRVNRKVLWDRIASDPDKVALARALIERVPLWGWGEAVLSAASKAAFDDLTKWRQIFPRGARDAIWFISEVSDASMKLPFLSALAPSMSTVIITRLNQNRHLKPFVRKVMRFDVLHPFQALSRMQRTSRVMFACVGRTHPATSFCSVAGLNVLYTAVVFVWLFDRTDGDQLTKRTASRLVRLVGMS